MGKYFCLFVVFYVSYALNLFCFSLPSFLPSFAFIDFLKIIYCIYSLLISFLVYFLVVFFKSKEYNEHLKFKITLNLYDFSLSMRRRQWHPTPVLLLGKSHGWRSLLGCNPWGCLESDTTERLHFHFSLSCIGEGNGNPLQCSCLENPRDAGAW